MKRLLTAFLLLSLFSGIQSCSELEEEFDGAATASTRITFVPEEDPGNPPGLPTLQAIVTIVDKNNKPILEGAVVDVSLSQGVYMTEDLKLRPGEYLLTEFFAITDDHIVYHAPGEGSESIVLPLSFKIAVTGATVLSVKVKPVRARKLHLTVFVPADNGTVKTPATALFVSGDSVLRTYDLKPRTNTIPFDLDPAATYTLVIRKNGYAAVVSDFVYNSHRGAPLEFTLEPGFTMVEKARINEPGYTNKFALWVTMGAGSIQVDWGDGTSETFTSAGLTGFRIEKIYDQSGTYYASLTGDVQSITGVDCSYGECPDEFELYALANLTNFEVVVSNTPKTVDFAKNSALESLVFDNSGVEKIILPSEHNLSFVSLRDSHNLTTEDVDGMIENLYANARTRKIVNGDLNISKYLPETNTTVLLGPPSAAGLEKARYLRDVLSWQVKPSF
jgi:hypothetical protein